MEILKKYWKSRANCNMLIANNVLVMSKLVNSENKLNEITDHLLQPVSHFMFSVMHTFIGSWQSVFNYYS